MYTTYLPYTTCGRTLGTRTGPMMHHVCCMHALCACMIRCNLEPLSPSCMSLLRAVAVARRTNANVLPRMCAETVLPLSVCVCVLSHGRAIDFSVRPHACAPMNVPLSLQCVPMRVLLDVVSPTSVLSNALCVPMSVQ